MNEVIINNWNKVVKPTDEVYVLGDFIMGPVDNIESTLARLNGKITLVRGNHDTKTKLAEYARLGIEVKDIVYIPYKGRFFIGCHFPMTNEEFIRMVVEDNSEVVFLYGHTHSKSPKGYINGTYHIGIDTNDLTPISIEQIWQECWPSEIMTAENEAYKKAHEINPNLEDQRAARGLRAKAGLYEDWAGPQSIDLSTGILDDLKDYKFNITPTFGTKIIQDNNAIAQIAIPEEPTKEQLDTLIEQVIKALKN